ncbi:hypothetical protein KPZU09_22720 [Klebsiella pneumoniae]|uniref:Uncharacterized protein n=1 Tax=Klebsiella pneumoniae TaxID=573 RepID=A0A919HPF3_KLEPN|nr:hypothetical protein KPZU09_22720 [Klebsiella pneumoniae]
MAFLLAPCPWGAFPGHTLDDIQSGRGKVHNSFMLEKTERTVIEAPFRPFPRSLWHGELTLMPLPPGSSPTGAGSGGAAAGGFLPSAALAQIAGAPLARAAGLR